MKTDTISLLDIQQRIKQTLETALPENYWITAEINETKTNSAGHCYLELVEKNAGDNTLLAKASATIWAYTFRMLKPYFETATGRPLGAGMRVLVKASVRYHPLYGLSLSISDIDPAYTVGEVEMQRRQTIARLKEDGVFDMNRELPLPLLPQRLAVISSEQAAGYRDFIKHLSQNEYGYAFRTQLYPSLVQGAGAVDSIIGNLVRISEHQPAYDAVVIIRGGGSAADLACFDEYELAFHVAQFPLPVLTGIGHEKDESIVDRVACHSLKTPTAVADFLVNRLAEAENRLVDGEQRLKQYVHWHLQAAAGQLQALVNRRTTAVKLCFQRTGYQLQMLEKDLYHRNPVNILKRGYAVVSAKGQTLTEASSVAAGDSLQITLYQGKIQATVNNHTNQ
jgi:exodeoxyribonuclease VII large subunit